MICVRCLTRARAQARPAKSICAFSSSFVSRNTAAAAASNPRNEGDHPSATSTSASQPFSTPLTPGPNPVSLGSGEKPKSTRVLPVSSAPAGMSLKGLNYIKGREDPVALPEEEYPEWLWGVLDVKQSEEEAFEGDEFSKSKKLRRAAAKRAKKLEQRALLSGDTSILQPKIPITQQTVDLPSNEEGTLEGVLKSVGAREEIRKAMRGERRKGIKTDNYLKGMR